MNAAQQIMVESLAKRLADLELSLDRTQTQLQLVKGYLCMDTDKGAAMPKMSVIKQIVAGEFKLQAAVIFNTRCRNAEVAWPRMLAMYLCRQATHFSYNQIAEEFGRDHGTVMNACKRVQGRFDTELKTRLLVHRLLGKIQQSVNPTATDGTDVKDETNETV